MSRPSNLTQLRDHLGNVIRLPAKPFATGGEGAVYEVIGQPDIVAKIYRRQQSQERCDKLRAMAKLCRPDLLQIAAWPTATLNRGDPDAVDGILMPRIVGHKEIHHLYSVAQRKKDFPDADWGFLLHTARNCAIAFESVHRHGHVMGDVNQKNVMVSKKGIIALVDCDSFQVKQGNRIFRCGVGVPEFTPPELHGRRFTELDRDANHDLFGLAVLLFHLLMMGRHPFAGVPQVASDIPIDKAIQGRIYAYARNSSILKPPPHVPPVTMLDIPIREMFERAFGSTVRPTATEWRAVLDAAMRSLQRCKNDPKHVFPAAAGVCPWCQMIAVARVMFFSPGKSGAAMNLRLEDILNLIRRLNDQKLAFQTYVRPVPTLPIQVALPVGLRSTQQPVLLPYPAPPEPVQQPRLGPLPEPPVLTLRPMLSPLPAPPVMPASPPLKPYPPIPTSLHSPMLHPIPKQPDYPPMQSLDPPDPFLEWLTLAGALVGIPVYFLAKPVGLIVSVVFGVWWMLLHMTKGIRRESAERALKRAHLAERSELDAIYSRRIQPIQRANQRLIDAWKAANAAIMSRYHKECAAIDEANQVTLAPWRAAVAALEADHQRATREVELARQVHLDAWEADNAAIMALHHKTRREIEQENQRLTSAWNAAIASRQAEYHQQRRDIDAGNQRLTMAWESANAPWIRELNVWRHRVEVARAEIKRLEDELSALRSASGHGFLRRKSQADSLLSSLSGIRRDYDQDVRNAEFNSRQLQLDEHLGKQLIRKASIKGITNSRIATLESFGIETAKDVDMLHNVKVPGIGEILGERLFEWRERIESSFIAKPGLPKTEMQRINQRYAPVLLPLKQGIETAISDLQSIGALHQSREDELRRRIKDAVQSMAVAEAHVEAMIAAS